METITKTASNAANAASKAIFGDTNDNPKPSSEEPISGETGTGTAADPYDSGNKEEQSQIASSNTMPSYEPTPATAVPTIGDPSSAPRPDTEHQGSNRPLEEPSPEAVEAIKKEIAHTEAMHSQPSQPKENSHLSNAGGVGTAVDGSKDANAAAPDESVKDEKKTADNHEETGGVGEMGEKSHPPVNVENSDASKPGDSGEKANQTEPKEQPSTERQTDDTTNNSNENTTNPNPNPGPSVNTKDATTGDKTSKRKSLGGRLKEKLHVGKH